MKLIDDGATFKAESGAVDLVAGQTMPYYERCKLERRAIAQAQLEADKASISVDEIENHINSFMDMMYPTGPSEEDSWEHFLAQAIHAMLTEGV